MFTMVTRCSCRFILIADRISYWKALVTRVPILSQSSCTYASPSSRGLGHYPFTVVTGVRIPVGTPIFIFKPFGKVAERFFQPISQTYSIPHQSDALFFQALKLELIFFTVDSLIEQELRQFVSSLLKLFEWQTIFLSLTFRSHRLTTGQWQGERASQQSQRNLLEDSS